MKTTLRFFLIVAMFLIPCLVSSCSFPTETDQGGGDELLSGQLELTQAAMQLKQTQLAIEQTQIALEKAQLAAEKISTEPVADPTHTPTQEQVAEAEEVAQPTSTPDIKAEIEENNFSEDFSVNSGRFSTTEGITIENGALYMGEFDRCADFDSDQPVGCISVCQTCGDHFAEYEVDVEAVYADGISERLFGLVLRFLDENGNHRIDTEDYFLGWVYSVNSNKWYLYEHQRDQVRPWVLIKCGPSHLRATPRQPNYLRVISYKEGTRIDIFMNDTRMVRIVSTHPIPGEVYVEDMPDHGDIGLWVAERGIRVLFDNYRFTNLPEEP